MKAEIKIVVEGNNADLLSALRDDLKDAVNRKVDQLLKNPEVKKDNTLFSITTQSVHG